MEEKKIKHLEMIQGVINRMASNSFILKGWTVTLVAGLLALAGSKSEASLFRIACVPIMIFWGLDSYYLLQERLYRSLYVKVCGLSDKDIDFSMSATKAEFGSQKKTLSFFCFFSATEFCFYFFLAFSCLALEFAIVK
ncbi:MAG: hypothetical protein L6V87_01515 [Ruminococcus sp.]|nr:MAG: hypothetical protein L6V87_01515 [Ruminococcus sp.]